MMTREELQKQVDELAKEFSIIEQFDSEVIKLEDEIKELEKKNAESLTFEDFTLLHEKKQFLPSVKAQAKEIAKQRILPLAQKVRALPVGRYLEEQLEKQTELITEREAITTVAKELFNRINAYNTAYKQKAKELGTEFSSQGYGELVDKINAHDYYRTYSTGYLSDAGEFFEGRHDQTFGDPNDLAYIMKGR